MDGLHGIPDPVGPDTGRRKMRTFLKRCVLLLLVLLLGMGAGICGYVHYTAPEEPELTSAFISGKLEAVSELTTARLTYTGLIKYSDGKIPFLTRNSFSMIYTARVRAGVDIRMAEIDVQEDQVVITLPECTVQSIEIDEGSIEFYDEQWALFNRTEKEDVIDMVAAAKADVSEKADVETLLLNAKEQTERIVRGLLQDVIGERALVIRQPD